ncbi:MAG: diguanylate cyclase [Candidatus Thiodiazotropha sp. (ex Monitilora ramsayi)]|nr:diguanylate cyclase [Candidatus Thiodiazotropha sp. (ex Monitilora ramsayi)]
MQMSPTLKITIGLVLLTVSILLLGRLVGFVPDEGSSELEARKKFCEALAVQISSIAAKNDVGSLRNTLESIVERNDDVLSSALKSKGGLSLVVGEHEKHWVDVPLDKSTSTHVRVPILANGIRWGTLEVAFEEIGSSGFSLGTLGGLLLFVALLGFVLYLIFIKRTLRELDPKAVIPERVRSAFNALSEGLIILDEKHQIILANDSFSEKTDLDQASLVGLRADELRWKQRERGSMVDLYPWQISLQNHQRKTGVPMRLQLKNKRERTFSVNTAPIFDGKGKPRGVLATFDDMTDLEKKHRELQSTLEKLRSSEKALRDKTVELELLASRDPLTGCFNRRAFFQKYDQLFTEAYRDGHGLVFMMVDIDNFKLINDQYGHANGDKVIKFVADMLVSKSRPEDIVGRYGGEEFSLIMPHTDIEQAVGMAERLRMEIQQKGYELFTNNRTVTASFGLAELTQSIDEPMLLINNADDALYKAKEQGRNNVLNWLPEMAEELKQSAGDGVSTQEFLSQDSHAAEKSLKNEIHRLEDTVQALEEQLEYSREEIKRREGRDELTGLPNTIIFRDRISQVLARCQRYNKSAAVLSLDIDGFHTINEAFGYAVGDQLLKVISTRLVDTLRVTDTVAIIDEYKESESSTISRINNDEFALILTDVDDVEGVAWAIRRLLKSLKTDIEIDGQELFVSFSIGVSLYPLDDDQSDGLLKKASAARYVAKQAEGGDNIRFFSQEINREAYRKVWLENQLHKAIVRKEIQVEYQPIVDIKTGRITKMEALARWSHPKVGMIPPSEFIPIAEHTGLIHKLGFWVLRKACRDLKMWHDDGYDDLEVSVNLSAVQFRHDDLIEKIMRICSKNEIDPAFVNLEITESSFVEKFDVVLRVMKQMSSAGIGFTLDDFGKGFSSLSYLSHLPINSIKIDQSFIPGTLPSEQDQTILNGIIALGKSLSLNVVIEGLETEAQLAVLATLGCDEGQGKLFAEPMSKSEATEMLLSFNGTGSEGDT